MGLISRIKFLFIKKALEKRIKGITFGGESVIEWPERLESKGYLYIGKGAYWALKGGVELGTNIIFGPKTSIWTYNHDYNSPESIPYGGADILKKVYIGDNCWIGYGVTILPGAVIGEGSIISANSVVRGIIPPNSLVMGNPASVIRTLDTERYRTLNEREAYYLKLKSIRN